MVPARVLIPRVLGAMAAASAVIVLIAALWAGRGSVAPDDVEDDVVRVGVVQGQSVPDYLLSSRTELSALTGPSAPPTADTWALVALDDYQPPTATAVLLAGATVAQIYARVPLADARTPVVRIAVRVLPDDVVAGMRDAAAGKDQELADLRRLAREAGADGQRAREAYESAARTASAEAAAYRSGCACVFAAVIRAAPATLQQVADRSGVRVVDPAPEVGRVERAEFRPPRPEQRGIVPDEPAASPAAPSAASGPAVPPRPGGESGNVSRTPAAIRSSLGIAVRSASTDNSGTAPLASAATSEEGSGSSPPAPVREAAIGHPAIP